MSNKESRDKRILHLTYLACMLQADNSADEKEKEFFFMVADRLDISPKAAGKILETPQKHLLKKPEFYDERRNVLMDVLMIMIINRNIQKGELDLCRKFSEFLGFDSGKTEKAANGMLEYSMGKIDKSDVERIIQNI